IDTVMIYGFNFPKGLMEMADEFGIDTIYNHLIDIYSKGYKAYKPNVLIEELVKSGKIGKKVGKGFL
ncbi:MAG: 3-hydroxyacyl-CoA dehydrogenase family protein, partial [Saccharolobus sp.]